MSVGVLRRVPGLDADSSDDENAPAPVCPQMDDSSDSSVGRPDDMDKADSSDDELDTKSKTAIKANGFGDEACRRGRLALNADSSDDEVDTRRRARLSADSSDEEMPVTKALSSDDEDAAIGSSKKKAKKGKVVDSDSDGDDEAEGREETEVDEEKSSRSGSRQQSRKKKVRRPVNSDSGSEEDKEVKQTASRPFKNNDLYDAESSNDEQQNEKRNRRSSGSSDSSNSRKDSDQDEEMDSLRDIKKKVLDKHSKRNNQERKSKSSAMTEIRSESQRMLRESNIGLPYFKPKQKSLEEFLNRKKGTPEVVQSIKLANFSPQADVLLQKRQKQLEAFYTKDVDESEEGCGAELVTGKSDQNGGGLKEDDAANCDIEERSKSRETSRNSLIPSDGGQLLDADVEDVPTVDKTEEEDTLTASPVATEKSGATGESQLGEDGEIAESLHLVMEDTPELTSVPADELSLLDNSQADGALVAESRKMASIKCRLADPSLEQSLSIVPRLGSATLDSDDLLSPSGPVMSSGAEQLFRRFVTHAQAKGPPVHLAAIASRPVESLSIITKQVNSEGIEVLGKETLHYNRASGVRPKKVMTHGTLKDKLRQEMLEKRQAERKRREEILKLNNEEYGDELPDEEEVLDEGLEESSAEDEESGDSESEPEENDVPMRDKKSRKNLFVDDEAEESGEEENQEESDADDESLQLTQEDEDEDVEIGGKKSAAKKLKSSYRKIRAADLLSEDSNTMGSQSEYRRSGTPVAGEEITPRPAESTASLYFSNLSSASSSMMNTEPRWTPFTERQESAVFGSDNADRKRMSSAGEGGCTGSPTSSQLARKRLGFEGLCDENDPEIDGIEDVVGLCSGQFITQTENASREAPATQSQVTTDRSRPNSSLGIESQDTVILTGNTDVGSNVRNALSSLDRLLGLEEGVRTEEIDSLEVDMCPSDQEEEQLAPGFMEDDLGVNAVRDSDDEDIGLTRKRRRKVISDDESEEEEPAGDGDNEDTEEDDDDDRDDDDVDTVEDEAEKPVMAKAMFDKRGRLRKEFLENEAELSGSEEEISEDEDERGLDRLELEEGDLEEIDEELERDKVGRIHQKVLLDEDQAEIRLFQERFLEDGDLHTDYRRTRQFRWKGLDDDIEMSGRKSEDEEEPEDADDEAWRLQRLEREKWLKEHKDSSSRPAEKPELEADSGLFQLASKVLKKISVAGEAVASKDGANRPLSKAGPLQPLQLVNTEHRSSFLARGAASLEKLSVFTKQTDERSGVGAKRGARNFVFATVTPDKTAVEDSEEVAPESKKNRSKQNKPPAAKKVKLDRTLKPENKVSTIFNLL